MLLLAELAGNELDHVVGVHAAGFQAHVACKAVAGDLVGLNCGCVFISHDLALVRGLCARAYVIDAGAVVEEGPVADLFDRPQAPAAKRLVESVASLSL